MTFDLQKILESERAYRVRLAARPIGEKLRMLDALGERERSLRAPEGDNSRGSHKQKTNAAT